MIVTSGTGRHDIDFQTHRYGPGSAVLTAVGQVQQFTITPEVRGHLLMLSEPFILHHIGRRDSRLVQALFNHQRRESHVRFNDKNLLARALTDLLAELDGPRDESTEDMLWALLKRLLILIERQQSADPRNRPRPSWSPIFLEFQTLVAQRFQTSRTARDYAAAIGVGPRRLNEICQQAIQRTAKEHIDDVVVLEAKRRLAIDRSPVARVAEDLGFADATNFTRYFKQRVGQTPHTFRLSLEDNSTLVTAPDNDETAHKHRQRDRQ